MKKIYEWVLNSFLKSRKFWIAIVGIIATFLQEKLGLDYEQLYGILAALVAMIVGISIEDAGAKKATAELEKSKIVAKSTVDAVKEIRR